MTDIRKLIINEQLIYSVDEGGMLIFHVIDENCLWLYLSSTIDDLNDARALCIVMCFWISSGIFAYLNYLTPKSRKEILELLVGGLKRLEYRGYDSAGKCTMCV